MLRPTLPVAPVTRIVGRVARSIIEYSSVGADPALLARARLGACPDARPSTQVHVKNPGRPDLPSTAGQWRLCP